MDFVSILLRSPTLAWVLRHWVICDGIVANAGDEVVASCEKRVDDLAASIIGVGNKYRSHVGNARDIEKHLGKLIEEALTL